MLGEHPIQQFQNSVQSIHADIETEPPQGEIETIELERQSRTASYRMRSFSWNRKWRPGSIPIGTSLNELFYGMITHSDVITLQDSINEQPDRHRGK